MSNIRIGNIVVFALALLVVISLIFSGTLLRLVTEEAVAAAATTTSATNTPIKHLVVIFQENISFDHYFATYPNATNPPGEPSFHASSNTPTVNGLANNSGLLENNTNQYSPFRYDRSRPVTCDMNHGYTAEQNATNGGLMDKFVNYTSPRPNHCKDPDRLRQVMGYYDGNTVTALWNYAQHYAMSDNFFSTTFGPSTPGHINFISGNTHGAFPANIKNIVVNGTLIANPDPLYDNCSEPTRHLVSMSGRTIGDLLNEKNVTWGWFSDGFRLPYNNSSNVDIKTACNNRQNHIGSDGDTYKDYYPDVEPFQYYKSTANPMHLLPTSDATIGHRGDRANHQYDLRDFWVAADSGNLPSVSFIKAATYQQGHPQLSDPLKEQTFLVSMLNHLQTIPEWNNTAVIITYDDSDGWYDHVMPPIVSQSSDPVYDRLLGKNGLCGHAPPGAYQDRCGHGPRLPLLVISPYAKINFVDHQITDQTSIIRFIEDNWGLERIGNQSFDSKAGSIANMFGFGISSSHYVEKLFLDPMTGAPQGS